MEYHVDASKVLVHVPAPISSRRDLDSCRDRTEAGGCRNFRHCADFSDSLDRPKPFPR